ncbi:MAG: flagellar biosynthetic protein FliR [Lachnospiraceae bacterium]|nr:flagellar biosynthetic protein FliR [Lachnospiraceae bacterium]
MIVRVTAFFISAPFFSMNNTPRRLKVGLGILVAYILYQVTWPHDAVEYLTVLEYAIIVIREAIVGLMIGFGANICSSIVLYVGRIIDMEIGLAMANQMDPTTRENASISGVYLQYMTTLLLLVSGFHRDLIQSLAETYTLIPVNGAIFNKDALYTSFILFLSDYLNIGFRICLPVFCVSLIVNVVLGIMAKSSPQMNMFAVGMQIKVLIGLCVLFFTTAMLPYIADFVYTEMKTMVVRLVEAIMPG